MANSGSARKSGSGNRRPPGSGNRSSTTRRSGVPAGAAKPATSRTSTLGADAGTDKLAADERARDRLSQPKAGAKRPTSRSGSRPSGKGDPRKGGASRRSTSATAGIFGGAFVVLAVIAIILVSTLSSPSVSGAPIPYKPAPASLVSAVTHVPVAELNAAGVGGGQVGIKDVFAATPKQPLLTKDGKPVLVYVGAEYCPYCAASRWPLVIALSRFGTFTGLGIIASSPYDVYANTRTWSFAHATYTSKYLVFDPTELETNQCQKGKLVSGGCSGEDYVPLQTLSSANGALFDKYDGPPYLPSASLGGIPFLDWGGKYVSSGAVYSPEVINNGNSTTSAGWHPLSWDQIVATLSSPTGGPGQAVLGAANLYTAAICEMTHNQPTSICSLSVIKQAEAGLASL
jgi:thiol-disulfide isomerase/thioredoxin